METIGSVDFNYRFFAVYSARRSRDRLQSNTTMKTNLIVIAATLGVIAAAFELSSRTSVDADSVIGYVSVLALIVMAALEYRINWKRLFAR